MKKILVVVISVIALFAVMPGIASANSDGAMGPAPNSGDGVSDGSGFEAPMGPNGADGSQSVGPAPNSGDGIPDGSGF